MLDLFFPLRCIHCDERCKNGHAATGYEAFEKHLCESCLRVFSKMERPSSDQLHEQLAHTGNFDGKQPLSAAFLFQTEGLVQHVIHHFKFFGMPKLARSCGRLLGTLYADQLKSIDYILPVPLHRTRIATRGYNQSEFLAKGISDISGKQVLAQGYTARLRPTRSQTELSIEERRENMADAFTLNPKATSLIKNKRVLILDDVLTTGATITSFGHTVVEANTSKVLYLVFAAAEFH